ncbi:MAG: hypothetical protein ACJAV8_001662 [Polaribacter sp.]|jgi:hypothetical protein
MIAFYATPSFYEGLLFGHDILIFALGRFIVILLPFLYHSQISESNNSKSVLDIPMYSSKDILPQSNKAESNFIIVEKTTSTFIKFLVVVIIAIVVFTPLYQSLGVDHFI